MLFRKQNGKIKSIQNTRSILLLPLVLILMAISACAVIKGIIIINENPNGTGFTIDLKEWSSKSKCQMSLNKGDELQIEVIREKGEIALQIKGNKGSEPYTGNNLKSGIFTVTVSETDNYDIHITGNDATAKIIIKNPKGSANNGTKPIK